MQSWLAFFLNFIIFFLLDYLQKILFDCWYLGLKNFSIVEEFNSAPCSCWSPHCSTRYVYASQMNVAKPFSALIGVYIKVIYSAVLVLTKVYTQTTTTAKTFTLINFLPMQNAKTAWSHSPDMKNVFCVWCCKAENSFKQFHPGQSIAVSTQFLAEIFHSVLLCLCSYIEGREVLWMEWVEDFPLPLMFTLV